MKEEDSSEYSISLRVVTSSIILIALTLVIIYFFRLYKIKKENIEYIMQSEAIAIEEAISNELKYAEYFLRLITQKIQANYQNKEAVEKLILDYVSLPNFALLFGWRKHSFIDNNFRETVTSTNGRESNPKVIEYVKDIVNQGAATREKIFYHNCKHEHKNDSLKLISIISTNSGIQEYFGAVLLSYDIPTMIRKLNTIKKYEPTNFIIIDQNTLSIIASSNAEIDNIIKRGRLERNILETLADINFEHNPIINPSAINIFSGANYHVKKIKNLPFLLITNLNSDEIRNNIFDIVIRKCVEVSIFCGFFLIVVFSIYKREKALRHKAELATLRANEAAKAKSNFLSFTVHEIRSPLGFILTGSELMTKELFGTIPVAYKSYVAGIYQNSIAILDFITDILDENQIMEGKFKVVNSIQNVSDIIKEAININKARYNSKKFELDFIADVNLPELICDQRRILQIMNNLISNAIKYSKKEVLKITISAKVHAENLEISVMDQGIGMTPEEIRIALSIHGVVLKKSHNFIESYGLGLPIVQMLLEAHDAELIIESKQNIGTTVKAVFPKYKLIYRKKKNAAISIAEPL